MHVNEAAEAIYTNYGEKQSGQQGAWTQRCHKYILMTVFKINLRRSLHQGSQTFQSGTPKVTIRTMRDPHCQKWLNY